MSLELALQENTTAVNKLAELIAAYFSGDKAATKKPAPQQQPPASREEAPQTALPLETSASAEKLKTAAPAAPSITKAEVDAALLNLAKTKGRDAALAVLKQFNVSSTSGLDAASYGTIITELNKAQA